MNGSIQRESELTKECSSPFFRDHRHLMPTPATHCSPRPHSVRIVFCSTGFTDSTSLVALKLLTMPHVLHPPSTRDLRFAFPQVYSSRWTIIFHGPILETKEGKSRTRSLTWTVHEHEIRACSGDYSHGMEARHESSPHRRDVPLAHLEVYIRPIGQRRLRKSAANIAPPQELL